MSTRGHERTTRSRAAPTASRSASRSAPTRAGCVASAGTSRARRYPSRRIGSSTIFRGKSFSARPGTKTTSKARPRAASAGATKKAPERRGGQRAQVREPLAPGRLLCEGVEPLDQGQREAAEVREVREAALDRPAPRLLLLVGQRLPAQAQLLFEAVEPPLPALLPADHRCLDQEPLPAPRGARAAVAALVPRARLRRRRQREEIVLGRHPARGGILGRSRVRDLRERHVLGEAAGGEALGSAR